MSSFKKTILASGVIGIIILIFSAVTFGKQLILPAGLYEAVKGFFAGNPELRACDYKDGEILLIKPVATGVGLGRYEAGDIVEIRDGQTLCQNFGNGNFLGKEERTQLLPLYYPKKLSDEEKKTLTQPEFEDTDGNSSSPQTRGGKEGGVLNNSNTTSPSPSPTEEGRQNQKMLRRRQVGVDYTKFLSGGDILKVRNFEKLDKLPEIDLSVIIDKKTRLSFNQNPPQPSLKGGSDSPPLGGVRGDLVSVVRLPGRLAFIENASHAIRKIANSIVKPAFAQAESVKIVDTNAAAAPDYTSLNAWEAQNLDLVNVTHTIAVAKCRASSGLADVTPVTITGWTTDTTYYIKIWTDPNEPYRHKGKANTNTINTNYRIVPTGTLSASVNIIENQQIGTIIDGLEISENYSAAAAYTINGIQNGTGSFDNVILRNNLVHDLTHGTQGYRGIFLSSATSLNNAKVYNNIVYNLTGSANSRGIFTGNLAGNTVYVYNNTVYNCASRGFNINTGTGVGTLVAENNIGMGNGVADFVYEGTGTFNVNNNLSSDATADDQGGTGHLISQNKANQFVSTLAGSENLHLTLGSVARNAGKNESSVFTTDIDNEKRPATGAWDMGADEVVRTAEVNTARTLEGPQSGLIGNWSFNGPDMNWRTNSAYDRSSSYATGTMINMSTSSSGAIGISGQALSFDGVDDYVNLGNPASLDITTNAVTISAWIKPDTFVSGGSGVISKGELGGPTWAGQYSLTFPGASDILRFTVCTASCVYFNLAAGTSGITVGAWSHIVGVYDGAQGFMYIYVNGVSKGTPSAQTGNIVTNGMNLSLGIHAVNGGTPSMFFDGLIDEARIYNRALSASEVQQLYQYGASRLKVNTPETQKGTQGGLVGNWSFNGPDINWRTNSAYDRSSSYATGTMINMSTSSSPAIGISGQGLSFDGVDNRVIMGNVAAYNFEYTDPFSFSFWLKKNLDGTNMAPLGKGDGGSQGYYLRFNTSNQLGFVLCQNCGSSVSISTRTNNAITKASGWTHVVVTYDGSNSPNGMRIYFNGVDQALTPSGTSLSGTIKSTFDFTVGDRTNAVNSPFSGTIDEVRVYNRVLSLNDVQQLYQYGAARLKIKQ